MPNLLPGQVIKSLPASALSNALELGRDARMNKRNFGSSSPTSEYNGNIIMVVNNTGTMLPVGGVVAVGGPVYDPNTGNEAQFGSFHSGLYAEASKPKAESQKIGVLLQPAAQNGDIFAPAVVAGLARVRIDIKDADHEYAKPLDDDVEKLESTDESYIAIVADKSKRRPGVGWYYVRIGGGGGGGGGEVDYVVLDTRPSGGGGPATYRRAEIDANGNWQGDGDAKRAIAPALN